MTRPYGPTHSPPPLSLALAPWSSYVLCTTAVAPPPRAPPPCACAAQPARPSARARLSAPPSHPLLPARRKEHKPIQKPSHLRTCRRGMPRFWQPAGRQAAPSTPPTRRQMNSQARAPTASRPWTDPEARAATSNKQKKTVPPGVWSKQAPRTQPAPAGGLGRPPSRASKKSGTRAPRAARLTHGGVGVSLPRRVTPPPRRRRRSWPVAAAAPAAGPGPAGGARPPRSRGPPPHPPVRPPQTPPAPSPAPHTPAPG